MKEGPSICPHCGFNLRPLATVHCGELEVSDGGNVIRWKGSDVRVSKTERCIVAALALGIGRTLSNDALIMSAGLEDNSDPLNNLRVHVRRIRCAFKKADPTFDAIKTVWGSGLRWAA